MENHKGKLKKRGAGFGPHGRGLAPIGLLLLISFPAAAEPIALSDKILSAITAGSLTNPTNAVARPSSIQPDGAKQPSSKHQRGIAQDPATIVIVGGAKSKTKSLQEISITDYSQESLRAANLINAADTDSANGINVLDDRTGVSNGLHEAAVEQLNSIVQSRPGNARIGHFLVTGASTDQSSQKSGFNARTKNLTLHKEIKNIKRSLKETTSAIDATVNGKSIFPDGVTVLNPTISVPDFSVTLPTFDFDGIKPGLLKGLLKPKDGAKSDSVSGKTITFSGPSLSLGGITLKGDDIIIGPSTLTVPSFSLGEVTVGTVVCRIFVCPSESFTIGFVKINDNQLELFDERIIKGANPIPGIVGYGGGYAFVGSGTIDSKKGQVTLQGTIDIDLGDFGPGQFIDFTIPWRNIRDRKDKALDDGLDVRKRLSIAKEQLPEVSWEVNLDLDLEFPAGFTGTFDGAVCFSSDNCGQLDISTTEYVMIDNSAIEFRDVDETNTRSKKSITTARTTSPVEVRDAEGRVLMLSAATADLSNYSIVTVDDGAQSEIRALNAMNGARAIIGNGLNVIATRSDTRSSSAQVNHSLSQVNKFVQIGGL